MASALKRDLPNLRNRGIWIIFFLLLVYLCLAQKEKSVIANFDFVVSNEVLHGSFWDEKNTAIFQYTNKSGSLIEIRTVDTLMNYTVAQLENHFSTTIEPVNIGSYSHAIVRGKFWGFPNNSNKNLAKSKNYDRLFSVHFILYRTGDLGLAAGPDDISVFTNRNNFAKLKLKICEYSSKGELKACYKNYFELSDEELNQNLYPPSSAPLSYNNNRIIPLSGSEFFDLYAWALKVTLSGKVWRE